MVRWTPLIAWGCCCTAAILTLLINLAGTKVIAGQHSALATVLLGSLAIVTVSVSYPQSQNSTIEYPPWDYTAYINGVCNEPAGTFDEETGPSCYTGVGQAFNLTALVTANKARFNGLVPPELTDSTITSLQSLPVIYTQPAFAFFIIGLVGAVAMLILIPLTNRSDKHNGTTRWRLIVAASSTAALLIAAAFTTAKVINLARHVNLSGTAQWTPVASAGNGYLGMAWGAVGTMTLASSCFVMESMRN